MTKIFRGIRICITLSGFFAVLPSLASANTDEDKNFLLMYFKEEELVVESATRGKKPTTQVAENITVITAEEIKLMNAHTVADVLNGVTGVQVFTAGGPGSSAMAQIQGSDSRHVAVFMDGIPLNNLSNNVTDLGSLPVQNIEKVEIIKGPASSAWGSALSGVINIITKTGSGEGSHGMVSTSYGERNTGDFRIETSDKQDKLGYYLTAGRLETDGFKSHNDYSGNNVYTKLNYDLTSNTRVAFSLGYDELKRGMYEMPSADVFENNTVEAVRSNISLQSRLSQDAVINISLWTLQNKYNFDDFILSTGQEYSKLTYKDTGSGASANITWKKGQHNVVLGADFDSRSLVSNAITGGEQGLTKAALYINDTISIDRLTITPGIRHDTTDTNGDFTSPSLGATYQFADTILFRAYASHGFSIPPLSYTFGNNGYYMANPDLKMEQVWSYQAGIETTAIKHVWIKISFFRNDVNDVIDPFLPVAKNSGRERRQGMDLEMKTEPVYHTSLIAGAAFMNSKKRSTNETIANTPQRSYDVGLQYDDDSFKVLIKAHTIYWNIDPAMGGKYDTFIYDFHSMQKLYSGNKERVDLFFDIFNMFNAAQYPVAIYENPERWVEAGLRFSF